MCLLRRAGLIAQATLQMGGYQNERGGTYALLVTQATL